MTYYTNDDFIFTKEQQHEFKQYGTLPIKLRLKVKHMVRDYQDGLLTSEQILTHIKDLDHDQKEMIHDYVLSCIDIFDPEEDLLDLCELIKPLS